MPFLDSGVFGERLRNARTAFKNLLTLSLATNQNAPAVNWRVRFIKK
jgi:hypothetical protein